MTLDPSVGFSGVDVDDSVLFKKSEGLVERSDVDAFSVDVKEVQVSIDAEDVECFGDIFNKHVVKCELDFDNFYFVEFSCGVQVADGVHFATFAVEFEQANAGDVSREVAEK